MASWLESDGRFFDGRTARDLDVRVVLSGQRLRITGEGVSASWPMRHLRALEQLRPGAPLRLQSKRDSASRLVLPPSRLTWFLLDNAPNLEGRRSGIGLRRFLGTAAIAIAVIAAVIYGTLYLAPQMLASHLPPAWRDGLGVLAERLVVGRARQCTGAGGVAALTRVASIVAGGRQQIPDFSVRVFDIPVLNAFTAPGGRIILTRKLIETAQSPDEVAGVIAHELGHAAHLDPEVQFVRIVGLNLLTSLLTGGSGGAATQTANTLSLLKFSRTAEWQADAYAVALLKAADIDPDGLRRFLQRLETLEWTRGSGPWLDFLSTHPATADRIEAIVPAPPGTARELLTRREWSDLKKICES